MLCASGCMAQPTKKNKKLKNQIAKQKTNARGGRSLSGQRLKDKPNQQSNISNKKTYKYLFFYIYTYLLVKEKRERQRKREPVYDELRWAFQRAKHTS